MKKVIKVLAWIVGIIVLLWAILMAVNYGFTTSLRKYIESFEPVNYQVADRITPTEENNPNYKVSFVTDKELKVMVLTDLHIGGGCWSHNKDMKTIYEVITMLQNAKPDFVILNGDNIFAVPGPVYNGGGTLNNKMVAKTVLSLFEHEQVYFTTVFGNHDTEVFDYYNRQAMANLYMDEQYKYCFFNQDFTDSDAAMPSITNQIIPIKSSNGEIRKLLLLLDSNAYVDKSIKAVLDWNYDTIHDAQVEWAEAAIKDISAQAGLSGGKYIDTYAFFHIPVGEYEMAYRELVNNNLKATTDTKYVSGVWDEKVDQELGGRIWFGGCSSNQDNPAGADKLFETLGPDGLNCLKGCFCGHDHVNNAVVEYKGVKLTYCNSIDNLAYTDVDKSGTQRGCTMLVLRRDGTDTMLQRNAYKDLGVSDSKFVDIYLDHYFYDGAIPQ